MPNTIKVLFLSHIKCDVSLEHSHQAVEEKREANILGDFIRTKHQWYILILSTFHWLVANTLSFGPNLTA